MRADITVAFYLRVNETEEDVLRVAKAIGADARELRQDRGQRTVQRQVLRGAEDRRQADRVHRSSIEQREDLPRRASSRSSATTSTATSSTTPRSTTSSRRRSRHRSIRTTSSMRQGIKQDHRAHRARRTSITNELEQRTRSWKITKKNVETSREAMLVASNASRPMPKPGRSARSPSRSARARTKPRPLPRATRRSA